MTWRLLDLFSGIGGFSLAAQWCWGDELEVVAFCEIDKFCQKVLKKHWPNVPIIEDVRKLDGNKWKGTIDIITGGFPCQDISQAKTIDNRGLNGNRSGLWSEFRRLVSEIRPRYVIVENVSALLFRGIGRVLGDLSQIGYNAQWQVIRASNFGAPHRRERVWIVAYPNGNGLFFTMSYGCNKEKEWRKKTFWGKYWHEVGAGFTGYETIPNMEEAKKEAMDKPWVLRVVNGSTETMDRLKSLGNAIVPQIVYQIFKAIKEIEMNICPHNGPKMTHSNSEVECLNCNQIIGKGRK